MSSDATQKSRPATPRRRPRRFTLAKAFSRNKKGATAVEFALVALPFFALLFAIFETALVFFTEQMLEAGIQRAARMIRTGQVQSQGLGDAGFKDLICEDIPGIIDCANGLKVDVRSFPDFGSVALPSMVDGDGNLLENQTFAPGNASEVVVVRAYYQWTLVTPDHFTGLSTTAGNKRLLASSAAFRNEPF